MEIKNIDPVLSSVKSDLAFWDGLLMGLKMAYDIVDTRSSIEPIKTKISTSIIEVLDIKRAIIGRLLSF